MIKTQNPHFRDHPESMYSKAEIIRTGHIAVPGELLRVSVKSKILSSQSYSYLCDEPFVDILNGYSTTEIDSKKQWFKNRATQSCCK